MFSFEAGSRIPLKVGQRPSFFCIASGYVKLSVQRGSSTRAVRICGPGDLVGYGNWLSTQTHIATALEAVEVCLYDAELFLHVQDQTPEIKNAIIDLLCHVVSVKDERIAALESGSAKQRVAATLLALDSEFSKSSSSLSEGLVQVDRKTLAELSGTVVETFSRVLTDFENTGFLRRRGRSIQLLDRDGLRKCAFA